jgi:hypothetical protein
MHAPRATVCGSTFFVLAFPVKVGPEYIHRRPTHFAVMIQFQIDLKLCAQLEAEFQGSFSTVSDPVSRSRDHHPLDPMSAL